MYQVVSHWVPGEISCGGLFSSHLSTSFAAMVKQIQFFMRNDSIGGLTSTCPLLPPPPMRKLPLLITLLVTLTVQTPPSIHKMCCKRPFLNGGSGRRRQSPSDLPYYGYNWRRKAGMLLNHCRAKSSDPGRGQVSLQQIFLQDVAACTTLDILHYMQLVMRVEL